MPFRGVAWWFRSMDAAGGATGARLQDARMAVLRGLHSVTARWQTASYHNDRVSTQLTRAVPRWRVTLVPGDKLWESATGGAVAQ